MRIDCDAARTAGVRRRRDLHLAAQELAGDRRRVARDLVDRADGDHLAAVLTGARSEIDDVIGGAHRLLVVLDDDDRVARGREAARACASRRALSRWCSPIDGSSRMYSTPTSRDPICVASRMRCASPPDSDSADAAEREVVEADVDEEAQALAHFLENRTRNLGIEPVCRRAAPE